MPVDWDKWTAIIRRVREVTNLPETPKADRWKDYDWREIAKWNREKRANKAATVARPAPDHPWRDYREKRVVADWVKPGRPTVPRVTLFRPIRQ